MGKHTEANIKKYYNYKQSTAANAKGRSSGVGGQDQALRMAEN
jgi:hypothetical protein